MDDQCEGDLGCVDNVCAYCDEPETEEPETEEPEPTEPISILSQEGETCQLAGECEGDLKCVDNICAYCNEEPTESFVVLSQEGETCQLDDECEGELKCLDENETPTQTQTTSEPVVGILSSSNTQISSISLYITLLAMMFVF